MEAIGHPGSQKISLTEVVCVVWTPQKETSSTMARTGRVVCAPPREPGSERSVSALSHSPSQAGLSSGSTSDARRRCRPLLSSAE